LSDENVIKGFRLCAMMGPDVPESVSQHHNDFHPGPREALPLYGTPDQPAARTQIVGRID